MFALAAFVLVMTPRHRLWAFAGSGACFAAAVLSQGDDPRHPAGLIFARIQNADKRTRRLLPDASRVVLFLIDSSSRCTRR